MYDPHAMLQIIDANRVPILLLFSLAMMANYVWFADAIRVAKRDRSYAMPLAATYFFLVHDASFVAHYSKWFNEYGHWYCELFWVALVFTTLMEIVFLYQTLQYGRAELFPTLSQPLFTAIILAGVAAVAVFWLLVKSALSDDLYILSFFVAIAWYPPLGTALVLRRKSRQGQTPLMWTSFTAMGMFSFLASWFFFGPVFQSWLWLAFWAATLGWSLVTTWMVYRAPAYWPEEETERVLVGTVQPRHA
ncbi:MAG: hypothetical protein ACRERD_01575 [Candidatus Binatia bacterium]